MGKSEMANIVKQSGEGPALQVTEAARTAGLAEEATGDGLTGVERWERLADVRVYGFDGMVLVVDDEMTDRAVAELVVNATRDTGSIHQGHRASVRPAGNGCMVSVPGLEDTGMCVGDVAPVVPGPGTLVVTDGTDERGRLAADLVAYRREQVETEGDE